MTRVSEYLRTVAAHGLPATVPERRRPIDAKTWRTLVRHAEWHRITNLLTRTLEAGTIVAGDAQIEEAISVDEAHIATTLHLESFLLEVADTLDAAGIGFRVLKGPATAHLDYPDPVSRGFGDIDLLVRPDDFERATAALAGLGLTRRFPEPRQGFDRRFVKSVSMAGAGSRQVDLHRTLAAGGFGERIVLDMLWDAEPSTFHVGDRSFAALGPEERLVHACYHAALGNAPPRLAPLRDIAEMLLHGRIDDDRLHTLATAWRGEPVIAHAITTAWRTLRLEPDLPLTRWAAKTEVTRRAARELARATSPGYTYTAQAMDQLRAMTGARRRLAYVSALAFPTRSYVHNHHPGPMARARHAISGVRVPQTPHGGHT